VLFDFVVLGLFFSVLRQGIGWEETEHLWYDLNSILVAYAGLY